MGFDFNRSLRVRNEAAGKLYNLFSSAEHFGFSHTEMLTRRNAMFHAVGVDRAPRWVGSYLQGLWDYWQQSAYRHHLIYGGKIDGQFYSTHRERDDYYEKHGIEARDYADNGRVKDRGHYWKNNLKPF